MLQDWHDFYLMVGPSAAALVGWLFVIATLTSGFDRERAIHGSRVYSTPTVFHLGVIIFISGGALAPHLSAAALAVVTIGTGVAGLLYCCYVAIELRSGRLEGHRLDFWYYAFATGLAYAGLGLAGLLLDLGHAAGPWLLGGSLLTMLLIAIHNAWDLVNWMAPRAKG